MLDVTGENGVFELLFVQVFAIIIRITGGVMDRGKLVQHATGPDLAFFGNVMGLGVVIARGTLRG